MWMLRKVTAGILAAARRTTEPWRRRLAGTMTILKFSAVTVVG
jgi:hypothetical protein